MRAVYLSFVSLFFWAGDAAVAAEDWDTTIEIGQPLQATFKGGSVRVTSARPIDALTCRRRPATVTVDADDASFFTASSAELGALADGIGAALFNVCSDPAVGMSASSLRIGLTLQAVDASGRVLATAPWRNFPGESGGQILVSREANGRRVYLEPEDSSFSPEYIRQLYPLLGANEARDPHLMTDQTIPELAADIAALPDGQVIQAYEIAQVTRAAYQACAWFEEVGSVGRWIEDNIKTLDYLVKLDASATGRMNAYIADAIAADPESVERNQLPKGLRDAMLRWQGDLLSGVYAAELLDNGRCDGPFREQGLAALELLLGQDSSRLIEAVKSGTFTEFPALSQLAVD